MTNLSEEEIKNLNPKLYRTDAVGSSNATNVIPI